MFEQKNVKSQKFDNWDWVKIIGALVVGLFIPDEMNPLASIAAKFNGSASEKTDATTKKETEKKSN